MALFDANTSTIVLGVLGTYVACSLFFLRFPLILHKKKKYAFDALHISHRGGMLSLLSRSSFSISVLTSSLLSLNQWFALELTMSRGWRAYREHFECF